MPRAKREVDNKPTRVPVSGLRDIMTVYNKDPGYKYRWVVDKNEDGSRIYRFKRGGYEFARNETDAGDYVIGQEAVYSSESHGSIVRLQTGDSSYSYLMRIREELFNEDQEAKEQALLDTERMITETGTSDGEDFGQYAEKDRKGYLSIETN